MNNEERVDQVVAMIKEYCDEKRSQERSHEQSQS